MSVVMLLRRRRPGVSIAMNDLPSSSNRTSTLSRVVPATSLTIIRSAWASVLTNVLLPTFRRPTIATFIIGSGSDAFGLVVVDLAAAARRSCPAACSRPRFCVVLVRTSRPRPSL